jgi:hypothetical protein
VTGTRRPFWGKYRARVDDNADPYKIGRLKLKIPDVLGSHVSGWALPAFPYASTSTTPGASVGLFLIPPADAWVWAEFEHGDPERPIWTGCFFPDDPTALPAVIASLLPLVGVDPHKQVLKAGKWLITIDGDSLTFEHLAVALPRTRVKLDGTSIKLSNEQVVGAVAPLCATVELSGNKTAVNGSALEVT